MYKNIISDVKNKLYQRSRIILYGLILVNLIPIITGFFFILLFSGNIPYGDQYYSDISIAMKFFEGEGTFSDLLSLANDHRPIIPFAIVIPLYILTSFNMITTIMAGYLLYILSFIALGLIILRKTQNIQLSLLILAPVSFFYFNLFLVGSLLWITVLLYNSSMLLFSLLTLYFIDHSEKVDKWFIFAILTAVCCMFSFSGGIPIWAGGILVIFLKNGIGYLMKLKLWIISSVFFICFHYIILGFPQSSPGYEVHTITAYKYYLITAATYPIQKTLCFLGAIGSNIIHEASYAMFCGLILVIIFILLIYLNKKDFDYQKSAIWYGVIIYGFLVLMLLTIARSGNNSVFGTADNIFFISDIRHFPSSILFLVGLYNLAVHYYLKSKIELSESFSQYPKIQPPIRSFSVHSCVVGIMIVFLLLSFSFHIIPGVSWGQNWFKGQNKNADILLNFDNSPDIELKNVFDNTQYLKKITIFFKEHNLNIFDKNQSVYIHYWWLDNLRRNIFYPKISSGFTIPSPIQRGNLTWSIDNIYIDTFGLIQIQGWAFNYQNKEPAFHIFLSLTDKNYNTLLYKTVSEKRSDVTAAYSNIGLLLDYSGFTSSINLGDLTNQPYTLGIVVANETQILYSPTNIRINKSRIIRE
jgi:hypothetical protein